MSHPLPSYRSHDNAGYVENLLKIQRLGDSLNSIRRLYETLKQREQWNRHSIAISKGYIERTGAAIEKARVIDGDAVGEGHYLISLIRRYNHQRHQQRNEARRIAEVMKLVKRDLRFAQQAYAEAKTHFNRIYQGEPVALFAYINEEVKK